MDRTLEKLCGDQVPGDTYRNLVVRTTYTDEQFKHVLVPVWLLTYVLGTKSFQVIVNGATGSIAGTRPWSWVKITLLILVALIVVAVIASLNN
jgi:hypothetical protein